MKPIEAQRLNYPLRHARPHSRTRGLLVFTWAATLLVSSLPAILAQELHVFETLNMLHFRVALLVGLIALGYVWKPARLLRLYFVIFAVLTLTDAFFNWVGTTTEWQAWFSGISTPFSRSMFSSQLLRLGVTLVMIATLWLAYPRWGRFLLSKGELNATAEPVRWLGMDRPMKWTRFGLILSVCITLGTLAFLFLAGTTLDLSQTLPLLPEVLEIAPLKAFSEEIAYRASLLAPLHSVFGKTQALLLTAALFGLWHYYGVPYGIVGVIMAGALGWVLGKSMLETKGVFWAWFIHFWQDVAIFTFIAAGSVAVGG